LQSALLTPLSVFGRSTYGIYLVHLLFVDSIELVLRRSGHGRHWWLDICNFILSVALSYSAVRVLGRFKFTRWLIP